MENRHSWMGVRREFLKNLKDQVSLLLSSQSSELSSYLEEYKNEFEKIWLVSSKDEMIKNLTQAKLVIGGDFHALPQAQRAHLRVLRQVDESKPIVLALECFCPNDQVFLDLYMAGKSTDEELMRQTSWEERWGFPWESYKPLIDYIKERGGALKGVNDNQFNADLNIRDVNSGRHIQKLVESESPDSLIYVIYGDLHLAEDHLVRYIPYYDSSKSDCWRLFLNSEKLFFDLAENGMAWDMEVLSYQDAYCWLMVPPWVKWQHYLMFLEETVHESFDEDFDDEEDEAIDLTEQVGQLVGLLDKDFGVITKLDNLGVYTLDDEQVGYLLDKRKLDTNFISSMKKVIKAEQCWLWLEEGVSFLSRRTVNHSSHLAGLYFHAQRSGYSSFIYEKPAYFYQWIWVHAVGFFCSKLMNPNRKAASFADAERQLQILDNEEGAFKSLSLVLQQRARYWAGLEPLPPVEDLRLKYSEQHMGQASWVLGEMLGNQLFDQFKLMQLPLDRMLTYLEFSLDDPKFFDFFDLIIKIAFELERSQ